MPSPFSVGVWKVQDATDSDYNKGGPSKYIIIKKATSKFIKYTRKCQKHDPHAERIHHSKIIRKLGGKYYASLGSFQYIEVHGIRPTQLSTFKP